MKSAAVDSRVRPLAAACTFFLAGWLAPAGPAKAASELVEVASFPKQKVTGIGFSKQGRIFACSPFWSDDHTVSVAELRSDGALKPYPDDAWNRNDGDLKERFVCVQSIHVDDQDALWILDPAAPMLEKVVKGGPKLLKVDLSTNEVVQTITFDETLAPERSYLDDVRVDTRNGYAFLTESGVGSLRVVNRKDRKARRVLAGSPSSKAEVGKDIVVDGRRLIGPQTGTPPPFQADGLAFDASSGTVYFHALDARALYKVKAHGLTDTALSDKALGAKVTKVADTVAPDGMLAGNDGHLYLTVIEDNAIVRLDPKTRRSEVLVKDARLQWPDSMNRGPGGAI